MGMLGVEVYSFSGTVHVLGSLDKEDRLIQVLGEWWFEYRREVLLFIWKRERITIVMLVE